ncbi:MAG TPA: hypothetical protein VFE34_02265 [Dongiaceae bacterium]|jgi:hypothetical protein|nr:hypothetical protein [Dongiaceae bacterium]
MRNLAMAPNASFDVAHGWMKSDLPIALQWRSSLWGLTVPVLWAMGWLPWIYVVNTTTEGRNIFVYALVFIGIPLVLALSAGWWVSQWLTKRTSATFVINDDYLEWQYEMGSTVDLLTDCGRFEFAGKRNSDARIEWDVAATGEGGLNGWPRWARFLGAIKSDRTLHARDVGLDRHDLESLCKLLNQLRDEATARD